MMHPMLSSGLLTIVQGRCGRPSRRARAVETLAPSDVISKEGSESASRLRRPDSVFLGRVGKIAAAASAPVVRNWMVGRLLGPAFRGSGDQRRSSRPGSGRRHGRRSARG